MQNRGRRNEIDSEEEEEESNEFYDEKEIVFVVFQDYYYTRIYRENLDDFLSLTQVHGHDVQENIYVVDNPPPDSEELSQTEFIEFIEQKRRETDFWDIRNFFSESDRKYFIQEITDDNNPENIIHSFFLFTFPSEDFRFIRNIIKKYNRNPEAHHNSGPILEINYEGLVALYDHDRESVLEAVFHHANLNLDEFIANYGAVVGEYDNGNRCRQQ